MGSEMCIRDRCWVCLGNIYQIGPKGTRATFGVTQAFNPGKALGQVASMSGTFITAGIAGQLNLNQLQYAQAMAGLGKKGYGVGVVNNQVVGVTPNSVIGTLPNASPKDMQKIREMLTGKSGPMKAGITAMQKQFTPTAKVMTCLLYTSPSPRDGLLPRMPSSA